MIPLRNITLLPRGVKGGSPSSIEVDVPQAWCSNLTLTVCPGTYVRTKIIDRLVEQFIDDNPGQKKQIISLGAGTDTRFFRLMIRPNRANGTGYEKPDVIYHEIDFPENIAQKLKPIYELSEFREHVSTPWSWDESTSSNDTQPRRNHLFAGNYCAHPVDLRTLDPSKNSPASFDHIDKSLPTLIISECCLVYLAPSAADAVALYFTQHLFPASTPVGLVLYEPINPNDSFGKVMVSNLAARGIELQTLRKYGSLEAQAARLKAYGFEGSGGADVKKLWDEAVEQKEKERVAGLEMMDEVEEWELLAEHYCVCWGWRGEGVWSSWKALAQKMQH